VIFEPKFSSFDQLDPDLLTFDAYEGFSNHCAIRVRIRFFLVDVKRSHHKTTKKKHQGKKKIGTKKVDTKKFE
jgi:hypothetical protein